VGAEVGSDRVRRLVAYGKVSGVGNETPKGAIIGELRRRVLEHGAGRSVTIPQSFGWRPELQLSLLEALPGEAQIGPALKERLRGEPPSGVLQLETMVATCGHVAAALHTSGLTLGPARTLDDELAGLQREIATIRPFLRKSGDRTQAWLDQIAAFGKQSEPLKPCLSHGDYKHEQLLFDGASSGLVDFDAVCQAEPALDLGKFLAHLRLEVQKIQRHASVAYALAEELAEQFFRAYVSAAGDHVEDERRLRLRTTLYETVALLRLALLNQQDLDETRLETTTALLEERMSVAADQLVNRRRT
jgi:aminoglycoside phosphotransferase (APT) family kinase protein